LTSGRARVYFNSQGKPATNRQQYNENDYNDYGEAGFSEAHNPHNRNMGAIVRLNQGVTIMMIVVVGEFDMNDRMVAIKKYSSLARAHQIYSEKVKNNDFDGYWKDLEYLNTND